MPLLQLDVQINTGLVPYQHQYMLAAAVHKWAGAAAPARYHGQRSLFSFGQLRGGVGKANGIAYPTGNARWHISSYDERFCQDLVRGCSADPAIAPGLTVEAISLQPQPNYGSQASTSATLRAGSPILLKRRRADDTTEHITYEHGPAADALLQATLESRLALAGLQTLAEGLHVRFAPAGD